MMQPARCSCEQVVSVVRREDRLGNILDGLLSLLHQCLKGEPERESIRAAHHDTVSSIMWCRRNEVQIR